MTLTRKMPQTIYFQGHILLGKTKKEVKREATGVSRQLLKNPADMVNATEIETQYAKPTKYSVYLFIPLRWTASSKKFPHFFNRLQVIRQLQIILLIGDKRPSQTTATIFKPNRINFPLAW
jgi:hypothetical protein